ncbi:hypothetical protein BU15DRAFT_69459 [Melanogaster broomeanus]|nr:hypothetical protein BU15DRAFT_69459 [Melanogaster broomeanus]
MRLIFNISDEQGHQLYTISTPRASKKITTVTKYRWSGEHSVAETMGVIEWHKVKNTLIRFNGRELEADVMLKKRAWSTDRRYFEGPDKRSYKWKLGPGYCWDWLDSVFTRYDVRSNPLQN